MAKHRVPNPRKFRPVFAVSALAAAIAAPSIAHAALEEVVVTARKRMETAQETPIAVTAFSAEELQRSGVTTFTALAQNNPNVKIGTGTTGGAAISTTVAIRGNLQNDQLAQLDASVGTYVDGFVVAHTFAMDGIFLDTESVQTLKGPQGTLFGRNTTGGALLIETKNPETSALAGYIKGGVSSFGGQEMTGAINIPLNDDIAVRLAAQRKTMDGYAEQVNGKDWGDKEATTYRAKLLWNISDATSLLLAAEQVDVDGTSVVNYMTQPNHPQTENIPLTIPITVGGRVVQQTSLIQTDERNEAHAKMYHLTLSHDLDWGEVKFLAGRRELDIWKNQTLPPLSGFTHLDWPDDRQDSYELQLNGAALDDKLQFTSGLYRFESETTQNEVSRSGTAQTLSNISMDSNSIYAQATYALLDDLNLTLGGRYTDDKRSMKGTVAGSIPTNQFLTIHPEKSKFNYLVSLDYKIIDGVMVYANTSTGYRSGSATNAQSPQDPTSYQALKPEEVTNYEIGAKTDWLDGQLRVNAALFKQDYTDYQYSSIIFSNGGLLRSTKNTDADISGGELEVTALLPADIRLTATYGYTDAHETVSAHEQTLPNIPQTTYGVNLSKDTELVGGTLNLTVGYSWQDQLYSQFDFPHQSITEQFGLLNVSASYNRDNWTVSAFVNNATDEEYYTGSVYINVPAVNATQQPLLSMATPGMPRVIGASVQFDF